MKIKLLIKKIKYKIVKFLYNYFKKIYIRNINIDDQVSCLKGIRLEDVTPELDSKAYAELKNNKH